MNTFKLCAAFCMVLAVLVVCPGLAQASLHVGDTINIHDNVGDLGGIFDLYKGSHTGGGETFEDVNVA